MKKLALTGAAFALLAFANFNAAAQTTDNGQPEKQEKTTIDAWRGAMPQAEQPSDSTMENPDKTDLVEETANDIQNKIIGLEQNLLAAHQQRDAAAFKEILADDFVPAGMNTTDARADKNRYTAQMFKNSELQDYGIEKVAVRVYGKTALATVNYKKQTAAGASAASAAAAGNLIATDVWVKNGLRWQLVSHHISSAPKP